MGGGGQRGGATGGGARCMLNHLCACAVGPLQSQKILNFGVSCGGGGLLSPLSPFKAVISFLPRYPECGVGMAHTTHREVQDAFWEFNNIRHYNLEWLGDKSGHAGHRGSCCQ